MMKKLEWILAGTAIFCIIYRIFFWTELNSIMILSIALLMLVYYPFGLILFTGLNPVQLYRGVLSREISGKKLFGIFGFGLSAAFCLCGILLEMLNLPEGIYVLGTGLLLLLVSVGPVLVYKLYVQKKDEAFYKPIMTRLFIIGGLALLFFLTPRPAQIKLLYWRYPDYATAYANYLQSPSEETYIKWQNAREKVFMKQ